MKGKILLAGIVTTVMCMTTLGFVYADTNYTSGDLKNLQDFILGKETNDLNEKNYDLNADSRCDSFDVCMMRKEVTPSEDNGKILVAYYSLVLPGGTDASTSASRVIVDGKPYGTTEYMAKVIQEETGSDLFEIQTVEKYPENFSVLMSQAGKEQREGYRPELATHIENLDQYDTVFVGYPNWWDDMPMVMYSFFEEHDFAGKTIIPFNSHGGREFSQTIQEITELQPDAEVSTDGLTLARETVYTSRDVIAEWIADLGYQKNNEDDSPKK